MLQTRITAGDPNAGDEVARYCGDLAVGCTDAAGYIGAVADSLGAQMMTLGELETVTAALESDQRRAADSADEARMLSEEARRKLDAGTQVIADSMAEFTMLTELVTRLGRQVTNFAAAMDQVRRVTEGIDAIARTTNMLALNAAIEAERAGAAGRTFAVVAAEVKSLAQSTRAATVEISATMASLGREAEAFISEISEGVAKSQNAQASFSAVNDTVMDVARIVELVDQQSDGIARSTGLIHGSVRRVRDELSGFAGAARTNSAQLTDAQRKISELELLSNRMFDQLVHSGFATADRSIVDRAIAARDEVARLVDTAILHGEISADDVFDTDYRLIAGSNPPRYDNRFNRFADRHVRPILDAILASDDKIYTTVCSDMNGYLPTHLTLFSQQPGDDVDWNAANCRHRRKLLDDATRRAAASEADYMMTAYRFNKGSEYSLLKNVFVPLWFNGRRWGNLEIGYVND